MNENTEIATEARNLRFAAPSWTFFVDVRAGTAYAFQHACRSSLFFRPFWWSRVYTDDILPVHIARQSLAPSEFGIDVMFHALHLPHVIPLLQLAFFIITLLEALAPLILILPRFRILWVWVIIPFHLSTLIAMNILFWENALLILLLFTPLIYPRNP